MKACIFLHIFSKIDLLRSVDNRFVVTYEVNPQTSERFKGLKQVAGASGKAIKEPHGNAIKLTLLRVLHHAIRHEKHIVLLAAPHCGRILELKRANYAVKVISTATAIL